MTILVWVAIAIIFALRAIGAFTVPLTGDEAYYWEWSRHLAAGYVDHPPAVAWTIRAFSWIGGNPGFVRIGFVLCGVVATIALSRCATILANDRRAGRAAALALSLTPLTLLAFGSAAPDGPYLMFWCLGLWFAARAFRSHARRDFAVLGVALGGVLLSRMFGFALVAGLVAFALQPKERAAWRAGFAWSVAIAFVLYAPFVAWNATHDWVTFTFSLIHRHQGEGVRFSPHHLLSLEVAQAAAYSPGIWLAVCVLALRPRNAMLAWTAIPLFGFLTVFALMRDVEIHWVFGPFASLCAMMGVAYVQVSHRMKIVWTTVAAVPALVLLPALFLITFAPGPSYRLVQRETGKQLRNTGPFEIFTYKPLAQDVARIAAARHAIVMTDGYGLSAVMDYDSHVDPVVIGYDWEGRESRRWYTSRRARREALFVDKEPLATRPDFRRQLASACGRVVDGGVHAYTYQDAPPRNFYFTWCENLRPNGIAVLRWEPEG